MKLIARVIKSMRLAVVAVLCAATLPASGNTYTDPQYSNSLIHPMWSNKLVEQLYCNGCWAEISSTDYGDQIINGCGDKIIFYHAPRTRGHPYVKNGKVQANTVSMEPMTIEIDTAWTNAVKIDMIDKWMLCDWDGIEASLVRSFADDVSHEMTRYLFSKMQAGAAPGNFGRTAGAMSRSYDLGAVGNPVSITNANITEHLASFHGVLDEQCLEQDGRYLILPLVARPILLSSELKQAYLTGQDISPLINGRLPRTVYGFDIYFCSDVPTVVDATANATVHYIFAGVRRATCMVEKTMLREVHPDDSWEYQIQYLTYFGGGVIEPKGIAVGYWRFS